LFFFFFFFVVNSRVLQFENLKHPAYTVEKAIIFSTLP